MKTRLRRDRKSGLLKITIVPENKTLEDFFETEIQNDLALIDYILARLPRDEGEEMEITGNAFSLMLTETDYIILPLFDAAADTPAAKGPREDFLHILGLWRARLARDGHKS